MSTTVNRAPRKTLTLPPSVANTRAAMKHVAERPPRTRRTKLDDAPSIWVDALVNAGGMHRDALQLELAVGLSFYATHNGDAERVALKTKKAMREVFENAGYACKTHLDEDYKTVARRIGVSADLYVKLGGKQTITDWVDGAKADLQVAAIMEHLKAYKFNGLNAVLAYVGKPAVKRARKLSAEASPPEMSAAELAAAEAVDRNLQTQRDESAAGSRRMFDKLPPGRIFKAGVMEVGIPFEATYQDVVALANKLMEFAKTQMPVASMVAV